ncbi:MAG: hypothetical protein AAF549_03695 [Pseudomonadota bacterium]
MLTNSLDTQISISDEGHILWQKDLTDPRPGQPFARLKKGSEVLKPDCELIEEIFKDDSNPEEILNFTKEWLNRHIQTVLNPLFKLKDEHIAEGAPRDIAQALYDALGILPREDLQEKIDQMDEEGRNSLRSKKIRFGPLVVYLPELNKPAGVAMQALLLSLWEDKPLPAERPAEGIVSFAKEGKDINPDYYRSIGYPVYGPRVIRVDMLDRVVCSVYDHAKEGKFQAQHQMAEWLGCNILDLYAVLEAMGHTKIYDPADEAVKEENEAEVKTKDASVTIQEAADDTQPKPQKKPELATFQLKRGKAINYSKGKAQKFKNHSEFSSSKKPSKNSNKQKFKKQKNKKEPRERVYTAEADINPDDNPFAVLKQLQTGSKDN